MLHVNAERLRIEILTENLVLPAGADWKLEDLWVTTGPAVDPLLQDFAAQLNANHPRLRWPKIPTGWCSWYTYGPNISSQIIRENMDVFRKHLPEVRYIQIDDGYQPQMGDWLESTEKFEGGVQKIVREIKEAGFEPAIWLAPFCASRDSKLFAEHPDWFVKDDAGKPLNSATVTFGGWRQGPWFMLDGTNPEAQAYLEKVFRTMREWGCTYFKLDANLWGALPQGHRFDQSASSVEGYKRGMAAIRRGAGPDSFILGCNHAYWPSLGEIHGSRTSYDIGRSLSAVRRVARENLFRNWMNDRLWWNDPDCILIPDMSATQVELLGPDGKPRQTARLTPEQFSFHAAATLATGGLVLSGDNVTGYSEKQWAVLKRLVSRKPVAAHFENHLLETGWIDEPERRTVVLLNWGSSAVSRVVPRGPSTPTGVPVVLRDFWTGESLGVFESDIPVDVPAEGGRVLVIERVTGTRAH